MLIDCHTHCFPDKIATRALGSLSLTGGGIDYYTDGTVTGLRESMKKYSVSKCFVLNIATNEHQMHSVNDFAISIDSEELVAFGSVYPGAADVYDEIDRIADAGLKGIKFHPEYQEFFVDDEKMKGIYKKIAQRGLITTFHAGGDVGYKSPYRCTPDRLLKALQWFYGAPVIAAHWGGYMCYEDVVKTLMGTPLYIDTSYGYGCIPKPYAQQICEKHGADRILFGTDMPWHTPQMEQKLIESLGLSQSEKDRIYYKNALDLIGNG